MKPLPLPADDDYYERRYKTTPLAFKPFNPAATEIAARVIAGLHTLLAGLPGEIAHRGSTAWGIGGKGDIEIGVFPDGEAWSPSLDRLSAHYGAPGSISENYARFNDTVDGYEVEVILLRGYEAEVDRRVDAFLRARPDLLQEYEDIKRAFSSSRREYQRHKDRFFARIVALVPDVPEDKDRS